MKLIYILSLFTSTFGYTIRGAPELLKNEQGLAVLDTKQLPTRRRLQDKEVYEEETIISLIDLAAKASGDDDVDDQLVPGEEAIGNKDNTPDTVLEEQDVDDMDIGKDEDTIEDGVTTPELPENGADVGIIDSIFDAIQDDAYDILADMFDELVSEIDKVIEQANPGLSAGKRLVEAREDLLDTLLDQYEDEEGEPNKDQELNIEELDELDDEDFEFEEDEGFESEWEWGGEDDEDEEEDEPNIGEDREGSVDELLDEDEYEDYEGFEENEGFESEWEWGGEDFDEGVDGEDGTEFEDDSGEFEDYMASIRGN